MGACSSRTQQSQLPQEPIQLTGKGCKITLVQDRAIRTIQLNELVQMISSKCRSQRLVSTNPANPKPCQADTINLYDAMHHVIKPMTENNRCSYVELVADEPQPPHWFVSHWWGEPVKFFASCVESHAMIREASAYWVCAYANNQWELGAELVANPRQTSFYKAMASSVGVLVVLDENAMPFTRIWCCFEASVVVRDEERTGDPLLLDMATIVKDKKKDSDVDKAVVVTRGLGAAEQRTEDAYGLDSKTSGWADKADREADFPFELLQKGFEIDVGKAQSSVALDKKRILNAIAGVPSAELDTTDPNPAHAGVHDVNSRVSSLYAEASWNTAVRGGKLVQAVEALTKDKLRTQLFLNTTQCPELGSLDGIQPIFPAFSQLKILSVLFDGAFALTDISALRDLGMFQQLEVFELRFRGCKRLGDHGALESLKDLVRLKHLSLDFSMSMRPKDISFLRGLSTMSDLEVLHLNFHNCGNVSDWSHFAVLGDLSKLRHLYLGLGWCRNCEDITPLQSLANLKCLEELFLDLSSIDALTHLDEFPKIWTLGELTRLTLVLRGSNLTDISPLRGLGLLSKLQRMKLDFGREDDDEEKQPIDFGPLDEVPHFTKLSGKDRVYELRMQS